MGNADFLFATPNFLRGMASALDLGGTMTVYNESCDEFEADARALRADWNQVGHDIYDAMREYKLAYGK